MTDNELTSLADCMRSMLDPDRSLTVTQAAEFLAVSPRALAALTKEGRIPFHRLGTRGRGRVLYRRTDLIDFRSSITTKPTTSRIKGHTR